MLQTKVVNILWVPPVEYQKVVSIFKLLIGLILGAHIFGCFYWTCFTDSLGPHATAQCAAWHCSTLLSAIKHGLSLYASCAARHVLRVVRASFRHAT